jgi:polysaccharide export outer membrane protein
MKSEIGNLVRLSLCFLSALLLSGNISAQDSTRVKRYFTVEGEVNRPGTYELPDTAINLYEALAKGGGMTVFGMRTKVRLSRLINGKVKSKTVNLDRESLQSSPEYIIYPDELVYVKPNKAKTNSAKFGKKSTIWVSLTSTLISVIGFIIAKLK